MKVSANVETASPATAGHNDRTMYAHGYERRDLNRHATRYGKDVSTKTAERMAYEELIGESLEKSNAKAVQARHSERVMTVGQYIEKHPPKELIIQLGEKGDQPPNGDDWLARRGVKAAIDVIRDAGGVVYAVDVHSDETTPHAHLRYLMVDSKGHVNVNGCMREHGIERPRPEKKRDKHNNEGQTFLHRLHEALEDSADEYLASIEAEQVDRTRQERGYGHESVSRYKARKRYEEEAERMNREILDLVTESYALADENDKAARTISEARKRSEEAAKREQAAIERERSAETLEARAHRRIKAADEKERSAEARSRYADLAMTGARAVNGMPLTKLVRLLVRSIAELLKKRGKGLAWAEITSLTDSDLAEIVKGIRSAEQLERVDEVTGFNTGGVMKKSKQEQWQYTPPFH